MLLYLQVDWFISDDESDDFSNFPFSLPLDSAELEPASANHNLLLSNIQKVEGEWWGEYLIKASDDIYKPLSWLTLFSGIWQHVVWSGVSFPVFQRIVLSPSSGSTAVVKKSSVLWNIMLCSMLKVSQQSLEVISPPGRNWERDWTTQIYIPEDSTLHRHCCENLKSVMCIAFEYLSYFSENTDTFSALDMRIISTDTIHIL